MTSRTATHRTVQDVLFVGVLAAVVTAFMMSPLFSVMSSHLPVNGGDAVPNAWLLAWGADSIAHGLIGFWSPPVFYPYLNTLAYSENLLGVAAIVAPVQWLWDDPTLTYNVAFLLSFVVSAMCGYLLGRDLTGSRAAGLIAAMGFAFAPYRWAQLTHIQVLWTAWLPLALWALHRALHLRRRSFWVLFVVALVLQALSNGYAAFQAAVAIVLIGSASLIRGTVDTVRLRRMAIVALVLVLVLSPAILAYYQVWTSREPTAGDLVAYSADLSTYLNVFPDLPNAGWLPGLAQDEGHLFPGLVIGLLAIVALMPVGRWNVTRWRWVYAAMAVTAIAISLGPEPRAWGRVLPIPALHSWLLSTVPLFGALRVPARFGMLAILAFTVLAAIGFERVTARMGSRWRLVLAAVLSVVIVWEGYGGPIAVAANTLNQADGDDEVEVWLTGQPPGAIVSLPMSSLGRGFTMRQQYATLKHGHPMIDGISRLNTPLVEFLSGSVSPLVQPELLAETIPFLRGLGVRYALVRPQYFRDQALATRVVEMFTADTRVVERARFGAAIVWEIEPAPPQPDPESGLQRVPSESLTLSASDSSDRLSMAVDGNAGTRWSTARPQTGEEWVAIDFDRPRDLARIDFVVHPRSLTDYPRSLEIAAFGTVSGGAEVVLRRGPILRELGEGWRLNPEQPVVSIALDGPATTRLVLRQLGRTAPWFWTIDELVLWERQ